MKRHLRLMVILALLAAVNRVYAVGGVSYVSQNYTAGAFKLSAAGKSAPIYINDSDFPGVIRAAKDLQKDITAVTKAQSVFSTGEIKPADEVVLIGTIGKSKLIDGLIAKKKLD